jgi:hypothetical protein
LARRFRSARGASGAAVRVHDQILSPLVVIADIVFVLVKYYVLK